MKCTVIRIDEALCNGCGNCIDGCHEGALQLIDGKAVMISDLYCDGLGACIGECPVGAIALEEREAAPYDEEAVMERLAPKGEAVLIAHLRHLYEHNEHKWVAQGLDCLKKRGIHVDPKKIGITSESSGNCVSGSFRPDTAGRNEPLACGCPGTMAREIAGNRMSEARQQHADLRRQTDGNDRWSENQYADRARHGSPLLPGIGADRPTGAGKGPQAHSSQNGRPLGRRRGNRRPMNLITH